MTNVLALPLFHSTLSTDDHIVISAVHRVQDALMLLTGLGAENNLELDRNSLMMFEEGHIMELRRLTSGTQHKLTFRAEECGIVLHADFTHFDMFVVLGQVSWLPNLHSMEEVSYRMD